MFKVNNKDTRMKPMPYWNQTWHGHHSGFFIVNFERISHIDLEFLLLTLNM